VIAAGHGIPSAVERTDHQRGEKSNEASAELLAQRLVDEISDPRYAALNGLVA